MTLRDLIQCTVFCSLPLRVDVFVTLILNSLDLFENLFFLEFSIPLTNLVQYVFGGFFFSYR